jgi:hypothetical protein
MSIVSELPDLEHKAQLAREHFALNGPPDAPVLPVRYFERECTKCDQGHMQELETEMSTANQLNRLSNKIADAIVDLVNETDGPVTLSQVALEIPGFATQEPTTHGYALGSSAGAEMLIWAGMSEAGYSALRKIINGRRVAIQFVSALPYILDSSPAYCPIYDDWQPTMLLPAKAANLETPRCLIRASDGYRSHTMRRAAADKREDYKMLTPSPLRFTADQFSI